MAFPGPSSGDLPGFSTSFPYFSSLPTEIRHLIWQAALSPRIVLLEMVQSERHMCSRVWSETSIEDPGVMGFFDLDYPEAARYGQGPEATWYLKSQNIPVLFLACKESHQVARKLYTKSFGTKYTPPSIWFNFEVDTLYLDPQPPRLVNINMLMDDSSIADWGYKFEHDDPSEGWNYSPFDLEVLSDDVKKVRHLAVCNRRLPYDLSWVEVIDMTLCFFSNLQLLTMVTPQEGDLDYANLAFVDHSDACETLEYQFLNDDVHALFHETFPDLNRADFSPDHWQPSDYNWTCKPYSTLAYIHDVRDSRASELNWTKPELQCKPMTTLSRKLDFLKSKRQYNEDRDAKTVRVTLTARGYNSLEASVPLLTKFGDLVSMFCLARGLSIEVEQNEVFICQSESWFDEISSRSNSLSHSSLWSQSYHEDASIDLIFTHKTIEQPCHCRRLWGCHHYEKYQATLWMEHDDWGLQDLFRVFESGMNSSDVI